MKRTFYTFLMAAFVGCFALGLMAPPAEALDLRDWGKQFSKVNQRFNVLKDFNEEAVLDKETQLVWEQSPATAVHNWKDAGFLCATREVGGRKGWKLASFDQLASLVDTNSDLCTGGGPCLPDGHPFIDVQSFNAYWTATTRADSPTFAWFVFFGNGVVNDSIKSDPFHVWCVRGGQSGPSAY